MLRLNAAFALVLALFCATAQAQATTWFNIVGDPANPDVNTIEVDPVPVTANGDLRVLRVRVSRSLTRTSWDAVSYRSYTSEVMFDCNAKSARYLAITYYRQPGWQGTPHKTSLYDQGEPRLMQFRDVSPNPNARIIRAACV